MRSLSLLLLFCLILSGLSGCEQAAKPKRVVIIGIDGLSVNGYKTAKHPNIDQLMKDGILSMNTRTVMPSVTMPNWTSHLTAGGPEQHGVISNEWRVDKQKFPPIEVDEAGYYPSIFKILKDQFPSVKTAFYYNWANLINSFNSAYFDKIGFEENDGFRENYSKAYDFIVENQDAPTLVFLYTVHVDHAGHDFQWMSPEYIEAIEETDFEMGIFIEKLKVSGHYEDTNFLLITDHGGNPTSGHGGLSIEEMEVPWGITGPGIARDQKLTEPNSNTNTAMVIAEIFGCGNLPKSWVGKVPSSIFEQK